VYGYPVAYIDLSSPSLNPFNVWPNEICSIVSRRPSVSRIMTPIASPPSSSSDDANVTSPDLTYFEEIKQPLQMVVVLSVAYSLVFLLGLVGNCIVVSVVLLKTCMHNVTNYFIVNLAVADILVVVFCLPFTLVSNIYSGMFNCLLAYISRRSRTIAMHRFW